MIDWGAWLDEVPEDARRRVYAEAAEEGGPLLAVVYTPAEDAAARGLDPRQIAGRAPGLRWISNGDPAPRAVHLLARSAPEALAEVFGAEMPRVQVWAVAAPELCRPAGSADEAATWAPLAEQARAWISGKQGLELWRAVSARLETTPPHTFQASALRWVLAVLETARPDVGLLRRLIGALVEGRLPDPRPERPAVGPDTVDADGDERAAMRVHAQMIIEAQIAMLAVGGEPAVLDGRVLSAAGILDRLLLQLGLGELRARLPGARDAALAAHDAAPVSRLAQEVLALWAVRPKAPAEGPSAAHAPPREGAGPRAPEEAALSEKQSLRTLKIDPARIDALMGLVGELVVAKNSLPFLAKRAELEFGSRALAREIKERYAVVNRITEELQGAVMRVRMVPLGTVFRRFPRLVRDLSGKLGKRIRLEISGEETEADKGIVEELFEPLVHLFRNAIDHGIEAPEAREAAGKPVEGRIRLSAVQRNDDVVLELSDDGGGIDPERVRRKAAERGLATPEELRARSDEEIIQLIFAPGFSTAEQVSELSGRGVGMDVVRTMVTRAGGVISVRSEVGQGTRVQMTLPMTMAVSRLMLVEAAGSVFGVPFGTIVETVRVPREEVRPVGEGEALVLRGRLVPLRDLAGVLGLDDDRDDLGARDVAVLVARVDGQEVGLKVDAFHESVDVVAKPLGGVLKNLPLFSGTALLGDGRVLLILDPKELTACA